MRNKDLIQTKLEQIEGKLESLRFVATEGKDIAAYYTLLNETKDLLDFVKSAVDREEYTL